jgi:DNA-binding CsgD family transcriptional regulator
LILFLRMDMRGSQAASEAAAEAAERAGDTKLLIKSLVDSGFTKNILAAGSGMETLERALAIPDEPESHYDSPTAKIGLALTGMDRFDDARVALEAAAEACRLAGDEDGLGGMALHLIELEVRAGRLVAAQAWLDVHIEMTSGSGSWQSTHVSDYAESLVLAHRGDGERAVSVALRGHEHAERVGDVGFAMQLDRVAAIGQLRLGRYAEAADRLQRAHARLLDIGVDEPGGFPMHIDEIEALVGAGRLDEAAVRLAELQGLASTLGRTRLAGGALQCEGLLVTAQGDADAGIVLLAEATRTFDAGGFPWEAARARLAHGTALRRSRQRGAAREVLLEAEAGFEASVARGWADLAREEAARVSGRVASAGTLTETEERITDLVAEGLSNKDVAAQLFLSPKTVESHLSRIYAKLGVRTRTELAARRHQPPDA